jgi:hypothetical protein
MSLAKRVIVIFLYAKPATHAGSVMPFNAIVVPMVNSLNYIDIEAKNGFRPAKNAVFTRSVLSGTMTLIKRYCFP